MMDEKTLISLAEVRVVKLEDGSLDLEWLIYDEDHKKVVAHRSHADAVETLRRAGDKDGVGDWIGKQILAAFVAGSNFATLTLEQL